MSIKPFTAVLIIILLFSCAEKNGGDKVFRKMMDDPETAADYCGRGKILMTGNKRDLQGAIKDFTEAIELDPEYAEAYYERGMVYTELQRHDKAIADYANAIKIKPDYIQAYKRKAYEYFKSKNYEKAVSEYSKIIELNPKPNSHFYSVTDPDTKKMYKGKSKHTEINEVKEAYEGRAYVFGLLKNYDRAVEDCGKALEMSVSKHHIYNFRASLYMEMKETQKACDEWKKAAEVGSFWAVDSLKKHCGWH